MSGFVFLREKHRKRYLGIIQPLARLLGRLGVHPNALSVAGLILSAGAGLVYGTGSFFWGAWLVVLAGSCDALDGLVARQTGKLSRFGAFFDSTLDRFGEVFILMGLAWHFSGGPGLMEGRGVNSVGPSSPLAVGFIILAISGSFMVSYTRARAEGLGVDCNVGWMQRPERMILLILGSLLGSLPFLGSVLMKFTVLVLAVLTNFTALHRMAYVRKRLAEEDQSV